MAQFFDRLNESLREFIGEQPIFFVATAPHDGRINLSPKGMDTLRCLDDSRVAYLDLTGSGNETAAHLKDDGRITVMFCSFTRRASILRLYGVGRTVPAGSAEWESLIGLFPELPGARQLIVIDIRSVQTSCGYAVPEMTFVRERQTLRKWAEGKGETGLAEYRQAKNVVSIDGLPTDLDRDAAE